MNKNRQNKALAAVLATSILVTGTFAWQSFSQLATNETITKGGAIGGRLHDNFTGANSEIETTKIQQVFVENYSGDEDNPMAGTADLFVRVRLSEYLEYGENAGYLTGEDGAENRDDNMTVVRGNISRSSAIPDINDQNTWDIYEFGSTSVSGVESIRTYRELTFGGFTYYMPTFNQNTEDKTAEINGTLGGKTGDRHNSNTSYNDFTRYSSSSTIEGDLTYLDENKTEQTITVSHSSKATSTAVVISMAEWLSKANDQRIGAYWVYDVDGWAYWAQPIKSQTATGLLLNGMNEVMSIEGEEMYYAVYAEAQIATAGDWGNPLGANVDEKGMYEDGMTANGENVLNFAASYATEFFDAPTSTLTEVINLTEAQVLTHLGEDTTITLDGIEYYVLDTESKEKYIADGLVDGMETAVLLWAKECVDLPEEYVTVNTSGVDRTYFHNRDSEASDWSTSYMRMNVLADWFTTVEQLKSITLVNKNTTSGYHIGEGAGVLGFATGAIIPEVTYDSAYLLSVEEFLLEYELPETVRSKASYSYWLRSAGTSTAVRTINRSSGTFAGSYGYLSTYDFSVRPAVWVVL